MNMTRRVTGVLVTLSLLVTSSVAFAQNSVEQAFIRGQNVQPAYEGWDRNPDGSYNLYFGYLNRNLKEEPNIPIGVNNSFSPGPADQGQPTQFYPKRQMLVFKVRVPEEFGNGKERLVWTLTHNGRTDVAIGWIAPFYEFDNTVMRSQRTGSQRASTPGELRAEPPSVEAEGPTASLTASVGTPLQLGVLVKDDGFPGPYTTFYGDTSTNRTVVNEDGEEVVVGNARLDGFTTTDDLALPLVRAKSFNQTDVVGSYLAYGTGLAVTWIHYRGPGKVTFDPMTTELDKLGGHAATTAHFSEPGTYVLRAIANDTIFTTPVNFTVTVTENTSAASAP